MTDTMSPSTQTARDPFSCADCGRAMNVCRCVVVPPFAATPVPSCRHCGGSGVLPHNGREVSCYCVDDGDRRGLHMNDDDVV